MPLVDIARIQVNFPFEPYDCQITYMEKVVQCLKEEYNGILESPTGTGKTLCLLCSSLAWLEAKKAQIQSRKWQMTASAGDGNAALDTCKRELAGQLNDAVGPWRGEIAAPRIIYASRTHSQLSQAVQELKRTAYSQMCVLGSREQLCIHPQVSKEENNATKVHLCRAKVSAKTCHFYNNVENSKHNFGDKLMDIEDLVTLGNKYKCCPYYTSRELKAEADIIFLPYNYLVDPKSRRAHGVELNNNIVIFDEAHNLEQICEDSVSFDWTSAEIAAAIRDLEQVSDKLTEMVSQEDSNASAFDMDPETKTTPDFTLSDVLQLKGILHNMERLIDEIQINKPEGIPKPGDFLFELFGKAELKFTNKNEVIDVLDKLTQYLTSDAASSVFSRKGAGLSKFADVVKIAFSRDPGNEYTPLSNHQSAVSRHYKVFVKELKKETAKKKGGWDAEPSTSKSGRVLSYWCFSPGHAMEELKAQGVKCIILTSGTLSPMTSFKTEMGISFKVELENSHVIEKKQVWIGVVGKGPDGTTLSSAYDNRFKPEYQASLGNAMVNFARIVPHGLLLFFPSYPVMDKCLESWTGQNIWNRVEQYKPIFIEPKRKQDFLMAMENFYQRVHDPAGNGAVFAAVCRGKVSEGLDFSDSNGRAVVILGLPFPPRMDPKVQLKMQFLDEVISKGGQGLSGRAWYRQQASRAVNQAIGRVIRHKQDYGAIILCDNRFSSNESVKQLPSWVRPYLNVYSNFGNAIRDVMVFFKQAEQMLPAPQGRRQRIRAGEPGCVGAYFEPSVASRTRPAVGELEKSSLVRSHVPSLRPQSESSGATLATLTAQYEGACGSDKQRSPRNLLDALDAKKAQPISFNDDSYPEDHRQNEAVAVQEKKTKPRKKIILKDSKRDVTKDNLHTAEQYLVEVKKTLSAQSYKFFTQALSSYKKTEDFDSMVTCLADIFTDSAANYHLFKKFYRFVRSQHKERFDAMCRNLTGEGCGYKPADWIKKRPLSDSTEQSRVCKKPKDDTVFKKPLDTKSTAKCSPLTSMCSSLDARTHLSTAAMTSQPATSQSKSEVTASLTRTSKQKSDSKSVASTEMSDASSDENARSEIDSQTNKACYPRENLNQVENSSDAFSAQTTLQTNPVPENTASDSNAREVRLYKGSVPNIANAESRCTCSSTNTETSQGTSDTQYCKVHPKQCSEAPSMSDMYQNTLKFITDRQISGLTCVKCKGDAKLPLEAQCQHVCCMDCWKEAISNTKQCPECKQKVKRKHLRRVTYPQTQNNHTK